MELRREQVGTGCSSSVHSHLRNNHWYLGSIYHASGAVVNTFYVHNNSVREELLILPFHRCEMHHG